MPKKMLLLVCFLLIISNTGCSVYMALNQQGAKRAELFKVGTSRSELIAEFGSPVIIGVTADGRRYEKFIFRKGYSPAAKTGRALLHAVADVLTYGLWEVVATPTEKSLGSSEVAYEVAYDEKGRVNQWARMKATSDLQHLRAGRSPRPPQKAKTRKPEGVSPGHAIIRTGFLPYKNYRPGITPNQRQGNGSAPNTIINDGRSSYQMSRTGSDPQNQESTSPSSS